MEKMGYLGLGTLEFLFDGEEFYFMEMNTRLQVEHPITEMLTRVDLVREQICVASGDKIFTSQENIKPLGHSIECRINAENPINFKPSAYKLFLLFISKVFSAPNISSLTLGSPDKFLSPFAGSLQCILEIVAVSGDAVEPQVPK